VSDLIDPPSPEPAAPSLVEAIERAEQRVGIRDSVFTDRVVNREDLRALIAAAKETVLLRAQLAAANRALDRIRLAVGGL
jgi:hypothetical protein